MTLAEYQLHFIGPCPTCGRECWWDPDEERMVRPHCTDRCTSSIPGTAGDILNRIEPIDDEAVHELREVLEEMQK